MNYDVDIKDVFDGCHFGNPYQNINYVCPFVLKTDYEIIQN